jgi:hypothetical protein
LLELDRGGVHARRRLEAREPRVRAPSLLSRDIGSAWPGRRRNRSRRSAACSAR